MLEIGKTEKVSITVSETAKSFLTSYGSTLPIDNYANVFATTKMIVLMGLAPGRPLHKIQKPNQLSVGVDVNIRHLNATLIVQEASIISTYSGKEDSLYNFKVEAYDIGRKTGEGNHTRVISDTNKFIRNSKQRTQK